MDEDLKQKLTVVAWKAIANNTGKIMPLCGEKAAQKFADTFFNSAFKGIMKSITAELKREDIDVSDTQLAALANVALNVGITTLEESIQDGKVQEKMRFDITSESEKESFIMTTLKIIANAMARAVNGEKSHSDIKKAFDTFENLPELAKGRINDMNKEMEVLSTRWKDMPEASMSR